MMSESTQMEKILAPLIKIYFILSFGWVVYMFAFNWYIWPKLAIHLSQDNRYIKTGCAEKFIQGIGRAPEAIIIDGKKYWTIYIYLHNRPWIEGKDSFPIYKNKMQGIFEDDLKAKPNRCHKIKYVSVIDLGFWKRIYIYDYIRN